MSQRDTFDQVLTALHDAMFDDACWPSASSLIDGACRIKGNMLTLAEGKSQNQVTIHFARFCYRGQRHEELEREYLEVYYPLDERIPRAMRLPDSQLVHLSDLYTEQERKSSAAYNEALLRGSATSGLQARLDGPSGSRITWMTADPFDGDGWSSAQIDMNARLLPHLRQYVRVRQALVDADALGTSLTGLLNNNGPGVIQLDRRGHIVAVNDAAHDLLQRGDGLSDQGGTLSAWSLADDAKLQKILARALPRFGGQGVGGSIVLRRPAVLPRLVLHLSPVGSGLLDFRPWRVAVLVLVIDPGHCARIDPGLVAEALGLTPAESHVAVLLAEGKSVRDIAVTMGRREGTIRWHIKHIYNKLDICRQVELVQLVLSLAAVS